MTATNLPPVIGRSLDGVRTRRMLGFVLDYTLVLIFTLLAAIPVFFLGIVTFGLAWAIYPVLGVVVALLYIGSTMGGDRQATWGMDFFSLKIVRDDGGRVDFITAVVHALLFWVAHVTFTPLLLLVSLFTGRKQLVHDLLLGTTVVRADR